MLYICGWCLSLTTSKPTDSIAGSCLCPRPLSGPQGALGLCSGLGQGRCKAHFPGSSPQPMTDGSWRVNIPATLRGVGGTTLRCVLHRLQQGPSGLSSSVPNSHLLFCTPCIGFFPSLSPCPLPHGGFLTSPPKGATCTEVLT